MPRKTCRGTKADGSPCESPITTGDGYCPAHGPEGRERMAEIGRKGAEATARKLKGKALDPADLPDVAGAHSPRRAGMQAIQTIVYAIGDGSLGHKPGRVMIQGIKDIVELGEKDTVDDLMDALEEWRETDDPRAVLELVEGGRS